MGWVFSVRRAVTALWERRNSHLVITGAHWLSLLGAFGFLVWVDRHQWFDSDEWAFLVNRSVPAHHGTLGLLQPNNGHWVTIPVLGTRLLFTLFGAPTASSRSCSSSAPPTCSGGCSFGSVSRPG
jgi:hypothetical protein